MADDDPGFEGHVNPELAAGLDGLIEVVGGVAEAFVAAGFRLYLVGGVVRDLLLGSLTTAYDIDLTTDAVPGDIKRIVDPFASALWTQGERFGTIGARVAGQPVEITTHRAEAYDDASRKPTVTFGTIIDDDLARRDFTINAMAISLPERDLLDPFGGLNDLRARRLATPLDADVSFTDDPLRMLRAARFVARFDLEPEPSLVRSATELADRLRIVSVERIHDELERLLALPEPGPGLSFLTDTGLLGQAIPQLEPSTFETAVGLGGAGGSALVRRAGLFWVLGPDGARSALSHLRYSIDDAKATIRLLEGVGPTLTDDVSDESIRRIIAKIGLESVPELTQLNTNVRSVTGAGPSVDRPAPFFEKMGELAATEDLSDIVSPLTGGQVIEALGLEPGPLVGRAVAHLTELRLTSGPLGAAEAVAALQNWIERGSP